MAIFTVLWSSLRWLWKGTRLCPLTFPGDWLRIHCELLSLQVSYLFTAPVPPNSPLTFLKVHLTIGDLLWNLEVHHRLDVALNKRLGLTEKISAVLPHVDTLAASRPKTGANAPVLSTNERRQLVKKVKKMMEKRAAPVVVDVVLIGGGHSHVYALKKFGMDPIPGVRVTLINDGTDTPYSGMLPGHIAGIYSRAESHIDVARLAEFAGAAFIESRAYKIDTKQKLVYIEAIGPENPGSDPGRPPLHYDVLSIDIGSSPKLLLDEQFARASVAVTPVKPISQFSSRWTQLLSKLRNSPKDTRTAEQGGRGKVFAVVGAGAGGVDIALSMQHRISQLDSTIEFVLLSGTSSVCPSHNQPSQQLFLDLLAERGIKVLLNFKVVEIVDNRLISATGKEVQVDEVFWCTSAAAAPWIAQVGLDCTSEGFIKVNRTLESVNVPFVFAAGDITYFVEDPCAKAGVFAVRQGPILNENLRIACHRLLNPAGQRDKFVQYWPQKEFLGLVGRGRDSCIATKGHMVLKDSWLFDLKDWIDRNWLAGYTSNLPQMASVLDDLRNTSQISPTERLAEKSLMRCGGCGSKVGSTILARVLKRLRPAVVERPEVLVGIHSPDDCAVVSLPSTSAGGTMVSVQTIDYFRSFIRDPYLFGKITAVHALSDVHAMCAEPVTALALCVVPFQTESKMESELYSMLKGCISVLTEENCSLVGGHSSEGSELAMGLSVTGVALKDKILSKCGARPGDKLILTKPLGTGTLLAAHMKLKAQSSWVKEAIQSMLVSNKEAGILLRDDGGATSCTDVTGFGLLGHLVEVLQAKGSPDQGQCLEAEIDLNAVPLLEGSIESVRAGVFSTLHEDNVRCRRAVSNHSQMQQLERYQLLFDPQTAGGLLATVPPSRADEVLAKLKKKGYKDAAIIGEVVARDTLSAVNKDFLITVRD